MAQRRRLTAASLIAALAFLIAYGALGSAVTRHAQEGDFGCFYMGASLIRTGHLGQLYEYPAQAARWHELIGTDNPPVPYVRPPFYAVLQSVIATWPLAESYWICTIASVLLVLGCWAWFGWRWGDDCLILGAMFLPSLIGIAHGQDCALMLAASVGSFWLLDRDRPRAAGAVLALGLFKFHLLLLIGPLLLFTRRWRFFQGFAALAAVEAAVSLALVRVAGIQSYVALMFRRDLTPLYPMPEKMPNLTGLLANFHIVSTPLVAALSVLVVGLAFVAAWQAPWWRVFAAGVLASLLLIPHVFAYDASVALPALLYGYAESDRRLTRVACAWLCTPISTMAGLFDPPWPALVPLSYLFLLCALAWETRQPTSRSVPVAVSAPALAH